MGIPLRCICNGLFPMVQNLMVAGSGYQRDQLLYGLEHWRTHSSAYDILLHKKSTHKFGPRATLITGHVDFISREANGRHRLIKNSPRCRFKILASDPPRWG